MSEATLGRRDLLLASGAVLTGAGTAARAFLRGMEALCEHAEALVLHPQSPDAPGLPQGPAGATPRRP